MASFSKFYKKTISSFLLQSDKHDDFWKFSIFKLLYFREERKKQPDTFSRIYLELITTCINIYIFSLLVYEYIFQILAFWAINQYFYTSLLFKKYKVINSQSLYDLIQNIVYISDIFCIFVYLCKIKNSVVFHNNFNFVKQV